MFNAQKNTIWLDSDGVMMDFDKHALEIFGMTAERFEYQYGTEEFWNTIRTRDPEFFLNLDLTPDAMTLYLSVQHLPHAILTGIPREGVNENSNQKIESFRRRFGESLKIYCTQASKKWTYCVPGDILIDDRFRYSKKWENAGGTFIHHKSAQESIEKLREIGVI